MNVFEHKIIKPFIGTSNIVVWDTVRKANLTVLSSTNGGLLSFAFKEGITIFIKYDSNGVIKFVTQGKDLHTRKYYKEKHIRRIIKRLCSEIVNAVPRISFGV